MTSDDHPELSGYEPLDAGRPLRSPRTLLIMRIVVVLGLVALIVPGILTSVQVATTTAANACSVATARYYPGAVDFDARFELSGPGGFGWQCYAIDLNERETYVVPLGIIPSAPRTPSTEMPV
ncbi:hypothetical protein E3O53_01740 [Cryobacterium sp. TMT2-18-3]|uniref:hypothetical protein n=1 Tax=unclassified Cryobacterium TaxID=2649013 RepID=UPI00106CE40A|nr:MULTISPECIES: hypothetical protein [unclassified Cryobacterium]TFC31643.1 hypothetical protein E3O22_01980 [Cryobacterium sp. TMT2-18-2]TFC67694.1 hypothetical protein E3O53_01740 [Cryobacterium sp. TMT2-18-3]